MNLKDLPNIGPHAQKGLEEVGVSTAEDLRELGAEKAWLKLRVNDPGACLHLLYGLEGAVQGIPKKNISPERKAELKAFFNAEQ